MSIAVFADPSIDRVALLEELAVNPTPSDLSPMYSVVYVDKRWTITGPCVEKPGSRSQIYCPPNFLHEEGKTRKALSQMADQLNMGCRHIDVVMAHEATYHKDQVGLTLTLDRKLPREWDWSVD
jgi:hypothetical protein